MTNMKQGFARKAALIAMPLAALGLSACATSQGFRADVSRFQTQLPAPQGQTFAVVADDPALSGGLEFSQYAGFVAEGMRELGYTPAANADTADLVVRFDYGIDNGRTVVRDDSFYSDPFYGPWRGYRSPFYRSRLYSRWGYGFYDPFFDRPRVRSYTVYNSDIGLKIDRAADGERLFEGRAEALSTSKRLQYLVPNLVEAMFTDFPGNSGETVRISVAPEDMKARPRD